MGLKLVGVAGAGLHFSIARQAVWRSVKRRTISLRDISTDARGNWLMKPISCSISTSRSSVARKDFAFSRIFRSLPAVSRWSRSSENHVCKRHNESARNVPPQSTNCLSIRATSVTWAWTGTESPFGKRKRMFASGCPPSFSLSSTSFINVRNLSARRSNSRVRGKRNKPERPRRLRRVAQGDRAREIRRDR
jgi:hypothetical protein